MQLSIEQIRKLDSGDSVPVIIEGRECIVIKSDVFESRQQALVDDWHPETMQRQMAEMMVDDWNDPAMSVYDDE